MTNEEMAIAVYNGQKSFIADLYINNTGFIFNIAKSFYNRNLERCERCGIELSDMMNEAYFVIPSAVEAYIKSNKQYKFITFLRFPLLNCFSYLAGLRTQSGKQEPLNLAKSLDEYISENKTDETTFLDTIKDDRAEFEDNLINNIALSEIFPSVKSALQNKLYFDVIEQRYKFNRSLDYIGSLYGITPQIVRQIEYKALRELRKPKHKTIAAFKDEYIDMSLTRSGLSCFRATQTSSVEWAVLMRDKQ